MINETIMMIMMIMVIMTIMVIMVIMTMVRIEVGRWILTSGQCEGSAAAKASMQCNAMQTKEKSKIQCVFHNAT